MLQSVLVSLTIVEIHLSARYAGSVCTVDDLSNELHLSVSCPGRRVDFGVDWSKCFAGLHERWQVLGSTHEVCIEHPWKSDLEQSLHLVEETVTDDNRLLLGLAESTLEGVGCCAKCCWSCWPCWDGTHACAWLVTDAGLNEEAMSHVLLKEKGERALCQCVS